MRTTNVGKLFAAEINNRNNSPKANQNSDSEKSNLLSFASYDEGTDYSKLLEEYMAAAGAADSLKAGDTDATEKTEKPEKPEATDDTKKTDEANKTSDVEETEEMKKIKEQIAEKEKEKEKNCKKMDKIEEKMKEKAADAKENIQKAAALQEEQVNEHEEESKQVLDENIQAYIEANKEGGEGMTREQLQENIKGALPDSPAVGDALAAATAASEDINELQTYLGELGKILDATKQLDLEIKSLNDSYDAQKEAQEKAEEQKKCCDPIGFTYGEGDEKAQYDFIVDDGEFDSTNDFLGASDQWSAMEALDTDKDGKVNTEEMAAGNIKAVKTGADGKQEVVDLASEFGDDFSVDLNSYKKGGSHSAIDTSTGEQEMLGTFNVNINGEDISAYNTLDDVDFLKNNYNIEGETDVEEDISSYSQDVQAHIKTYEFYEKEEIPQLQNDLKDVFNKIGLTDEQINEINATTKKEADQKVQDVISGLAAEESDDAKKTDEKEEADETTDSPDVTDETEKDSVGEIADVENEEGTNENGEAEDETIVVNENPFDQDVQEDQDLYKLLEMAA